MPTKNLIGPSPRDPRDEVLTLRIRGRVLPEMAAALAGPRCSDVGETAGHSRPTPLSGAAEAGDQPG